MKTTTLTPDDFKALNDALETALQTIVKLCEAGDREENEGRADAILNLQRLMAKAEDVVIHRRDDDVLLQKIKTFAENHGCPCILHDDCVEVEIAWHKPETCEAGVEYHKVKTMTEARKLMGY